MEITSKRNETVLSPLFLFKCLAIPTKGDFQVRLFHSVIVTISMLLMLPLGSSATATTNYSHPSFSVTENQTLSLRETGSQLVIDAIEDALYRGGLALFDEGFQIDSSLSWVGEESTDVAFEGEIDLVIPFYNENGHLIFTQPGIVFWKGHGEEERADGNFGIVYRTNLANTPIGIDAIGGASIFYDWDFDRVGHKRLGIGVDMQSGIFHGALNYYHPLSSEKDGRRKDFIEKTLKGLDTRIALEKETIRAGASLGYWRHEGGADVADDWRVSVGADVGLRIFPGVFIEADWEKHQEDFVINQRWSLGLAFRFSLPDFEGQNYGDGSMSSNLYKVVEREKRVLYEEREILNEEDEEPVIEEAALLSLSAESTSISEGETTTLTISLSKALSEDVVINLLEGGADGGADYGTSADWHLNVGGTDCATASGTDCQVTIPADDTTVEITIVTNTDSAFELPEDFTISITVDSGGTDLLPPGSRSSLDFTLQNPMPTVSLNAVAGSTTTGNVEFAIRMSETRSESVAINIVTESPSQVYDVNNGWFVRYQIVQAGQTPGTGILDPSSSTTCNTATGDSCQVIIPAGATTVRVQAIVDGNLRGTSYTVSIVIPQASENLVQRGPWSQRFGRV